MEDSQPMNAVQPAIRPLFRTKAINEILEIHSGPFELKLKQGTSIGGEGVIQFLWLPRPRLSFYFAPKTLTSFHLIADFEPTLVLPNGESSVTVLTRISDRVLGSINGPFNIGTGKHASRVVFHIVNLPLIIGEWVKTESHTPRGRVKLTADEWEILLDPTNELMDLKEVLESEGGYAITYVGSLQRCDGKSFLIEEADEVLDALRYMLSFACGHWIPVMFRSYQSHGGVQVKFDATNWLMGDYHGRFTWFTGWADALNELFQTFYLRWRDPLWRGTLQRVIWWYIGSNESGAGLDGAIILTQVALELLAWVVFIEDGGIVSQRGFDGLSAADKLRLLLTWAKVPLEIPATCANFGTFAKEHKWTAGPWAFSEIRNALVHPKHRDILKGEPSIMYEAWTLGMWYLDLATLKACNFSGNYVNRLNAAFHGQTETVPWSPKST